MNTFFTADTHFGHSKIIEYCKRPFANAAHMEDALVFEWNAVVRPEDLVYHLGDVAFLRDAESDQILSRLNGRKILVRGNHDRNRFRGKWAHRWEAIHEFGCDIKCSSPMNPLAQKIVLCHYPLESWEKMKYGTWHLHGHSHGNLPGFGKRMDVGVDALLSTSYAPVSFDELVSILRPRPAEARDHHMERV